MSDKSLLDFLEKLHQRLSKDSEVYRSKTSNIKVHEFGVVALELVENTLNQMGADGIPMDDEDIRYITGITREYYKKLRLAFTTNNKDKSFITNVSNTAQFKVTITPKNRRKKGAKNRSKTDVFKAIASKKQFYQDAFYDDIEEFYIQNNAKFIKGAFLDITHQGDSAVSTQQVKVAKEELTGSTFATSHKKFLESQGLDLTVVKTDKSVIVSLGASTKNRQEDGKEEAANKQAYKNALNAAITKLDVPNLEGSDSLKESARKEAIDIVIAPFSKLKGAKVKKENTKRKKSSGKKKTKKIEPKLTLAGVIPYTNDIPEPKRRNKNSSISLQALIPVINQRLPQTIAANMGSPALNYRTGRFADSARVTDITMTNKGFPSIGYTYMKDPYQIYESPGGNPNFATPARDPRNIIGQSIREIATGLIKQRFYTRRG
jgi:hypothetical protein